MVRGDVGTDELLGLCLCPCTLGEMGVAGSFGGSGMAEEIEGTDGRSLHRSSVASSPWTAFTPVSGWVGSLHGSHPFAWIFIHP